MMLDIKIAIGVPSQVTGYMIVSHKTVDYFTLDIIVFLTNILLKDCFDKQKLLEVAITAKVAPNAQRCSKVAERNQYKPTYRGGGVGRYVPFGSLFLTLLIHITVF